MILASRSLLKRFLLLVVLISVRRAVAGQRILLVNLSVLSAGAAVALADLRRVRISILLNLKLLFLLWIWTLIIQPVAGLFEADGDCGRVGALLLQIDRLLVWWRLIMDL